MDKILTAEDKRKFLLGFIPAIASFFIYLSTLARVVPPRDSGEFIASAFTLGINHPPGYPIYTIIGKLFTYLPFQNVLFRVNLMSAVFASLTVYILYMIIYRLTKSVFAGVSASLIFAVSRTFWSQSVIAEVYTLNSFFFALCLYILVLWTERINNGDQPNKMLYLLSFIYGLSLANHHTMLLLSPALIFWVLWNKPKILRDFNVILICLGLFFLGLSVYLFMPIRSYADPYIDWSDTQNFDSFIKHVFRFQYRRVEQAGITLSSILALTALYFKILYKQFSPYLVWLPFVGTPLMFIKKPKWAVFTLLSFFLTVFVFIFITNLKLNVRVEAEFDVFFINSFLLLSVFSAFAFQKLEEVLKWLNVRFVARIVTLIVLLSFVLPAFSNVKSCDMRNYYFADDLALNTLMTLKPGAIFFPGSDTGLFTIWYYQLVEGRRPDVRVVSTTTHVWRAKQVKKRWPDLISVPNVEMFRSGEEYISDIVKYNIDKYPIYAGQKGDEMLKGYFQHMVPEGMLYRVLKTDDPEIQINHMEGNLYLWRDYMFRGKYKTSDHDDFFTQLLISNYSLAHDFSGLIYFKGGRTSDARREFEKARKMAPNFSPWSAE